ncbi:hypothetical protein Taro_048959 [Colocasia esculenta]|uniref:Ribosomal eL28/Mak16 domain-containing protein n=1 Tax=Colocasia esculenta TaxID=4460 RepID=A0A843X9L2_COLES|nr:hypothetical protein [Colocasia esculenta]
MNLTAASGAIKIQGQRPPMVSLTWFPRSWGGFWFVRSSPKKAMEIKSSGEGYLFDLAEEGFIARRAASESHTFPLFVMASIPGDLIWEIVKRNNAFLVKEFGNGTAMVQFRKKKNNLYNVNSIKHSRLANKNTISIQPGEKDLSVVLATTKIKKHSKPAKLFHRSVMKKEFRKMAKAVVN